MAKMYRNLNFVKDAVKNSYDLEYLGVLSDRPCVHQLYLFSHGLQPERQRYVLKELTSDELEIKAYTYYLPQAVRLFGAFETFILPELVELFETPDFTYLLLPYYEGEIFGDTTDNLSLAEGMVKIITELWNIDSKALIPDGRIFNFDGLELVEDDANSYLDQAFDAKLLDRSRERIIRQQFKKILSAGRNQQSFFNNGDFLPRNIILQANGKFVLLDWPSIFSPLEYMLVDPWLLNVKQKQWREVYAGLFEKALPVRSVNIQYHLMRQSIARAVQAFNAYQEGNEEAMVMMEEFLKYFYISLDGITSLTAIG